MKSVVVFFPHSFSLFIFCRLATITSTGTAIQTTGSTLSTTSTRQTSSCCSTTYQTHLKQQQQPKPAQRRQRPAPRPPLTQTPTTPTASTSKTFAAVVAKQEPLSPQPTLRGRPDHRIPRQAPHRPPESNQQESEIYFPWFQLYELVLASRDLYNELYENHYI